VNQTIDLRGASGAVYRYREVEQDRMQTPMGGNYVYVKRASNEVEVLYAGEAANLAEGLWEMWQRAQKEFGATGVYLRLNVGRVVRHEELQDVVAALQPPMNAS